MRRRRSWLPLVALCLLLAMAGCDPNKIIPSEVRTESAAPDPADVAAGGLFEGVRVFGSGDWELSFRDLSTGPIQRVNVRYLQNGVQRHEANLAPGGATLEPLRVPPAVFGSASHWIASQQLFDANNRAILPQPNEIPLQVRP